MTIRGSLWVSTRATKTRWTMRKVFLIGLAVVGLLFSTTIALADNAWGNYHWARTSNPFNLKLEQNLSTTDWRSHLTNVAGDWSKAGVLDTKVVNEVKKGGCTFVYKGKVVVCNANSGRTGWLGLARIWPDSNGHINYAMAQVNDYYFKTAYYNKPNAKRHVLCQEVGHTLGLDHQAGVSCMNDLAGLFDTAYISPDPHDISMLDDTIYGHTDSTSTIAASSVSSSGKEVGNGNDFGVAIGRDAKGRPNQFVKDLGNGEKVYTWVTWAD